MKLQDQLHRWSDITDENLRFFKQIGVDYVVVMSPPSVEAGGDPTKDLEMANALVSSHGMRLYVIQMAERIWDEITLGLEGRDEKIARWCSVLKAMGKVGIPVLGYVFNAIGHFRTTSSTGRGGAKYSRFDFEEYQRKGGQSLYSEEEKTAVSKSIDRRISEESLWDNMQYFLQRVIPVAEEANVKMALHPDDPPLSEPLGGAARIITSVENYKRVMEMVPSPSNCIEFCQGCFSEMGTDVLEAIRYFGSRGKIQYVHFRNIRGNPCSFEEVFVDEGDMDMVKAMQMYKEVGFEGPFMMDHTPEIEGDSQDRIGRAYAAGYIRALLQSVYGRA